MDGAMDATHGGVVVVFDFSPGVGDLSKAFAKTLLSGGRALFAALVNDESHEQFLHKQLQMEIERMLMEGTLIIPGQCMRKMK